MRSQKRNQNEVSISWINKIPLCAKASQKRKPVAFDFKRAPQHFFVDASCWAGALKSQKRMAFESDETTISRHLLVAWLDEAVALGKVLPFERENLQKKLGAWSERHVLSFLQNKPFALNASLSSSLHQNKAHHGAPNLFSKKEHSKLQVFAQALGVKHWQSLS